MNVIGAVGIPTLKRYDLLESLLHSLAGGSTIPAEVVIIDNGRDWQGGLTRALLSRRMMLGEAYPFLIRVALTREPLGLAASWNRLIEDTTEPRLLCNDDLRFAPTAYETVMSTPGDFVSPLAGSNAFSCFRISDRCLEAVGMFDETISPGYAYFEDDDYAKRMALKGIPITPCHAHLDHVGSATLKSYTPEELQDHHRKFQLACNNFVRKWGHLPNKS